MCAVHFRACERSGLSGPMGRVTLDAARAWEVQRSAGRPLICDTEEEERVEVKG